MRRLGLGLGIGAQRASGGGGATIPAAFTAGQWTLADSPSVDGDKLTLNITALPSDGGSAITALQFKVDPGAWQTLSGTGTGARTITVLAGALAEVQVRAVNAIGNGTASDTKTVTPTALAGPTNTVAPAMTGTFTVGQVITVGNGTWSVTPDEYERRWTYGSTLLSGETASTYTIDDFTFGQNLFAEVRCRQTAGAWSNWITATGGQTVAANAQDVVWEATLTGGGNPRTFPFTPAVTEGDMIVFMVKATAGSLSSGFVQGDFNIGTMQGTSTFNNGECLACVTYVCPTSEAGGIQLIAGHGGGASGIDCLAVNLGPHIFNSIGFANSDSSGAYNFATPSAPANAKVLWAQANRAGGPTYTASPTPPSKATAPPYSDGGTFDSGDASTHFWFVRTQAVAGTVASQSLTPSGYSFRKTFTATFTPQIVSPGVPDGKYIADDNGAGIARTSTISSMVTDGVTINLNGVSRKVGNYISNNLGLGTLFIYDAGAGVPILSHTGDVMWKNPRAIVDGTDAQPFVDPASESPPMYGPLYNAGLAQATPFTAVAGDTLLISVNRATPLGSSKVVKYITVHVVGTIPYDDEFAPPYVWDASLGAKPRFRFSDWNQGTKPLPSLAAQSNPPDLAVVQQTYNRRTIDLVNTWNNYSINAGVTAAGLSQSTYGREMLSWENNALAVICGNYTLAQKKPLLVGFLQRGIDCWGVYKSGKAQTPGSIWYSADGGHKMGRKLPIILAGHMLGDNAMRDVDSTAADRDFSEDGQTFYVNQALIDFTQDPGWAGTSYTTATGRPYEAFVQGMLDGQSLNYPMPEWVGLLYDPTLSYAEFNAHWNGHGYRFNGDSGMKDWSIHVLLAAAMGLDAYWGGNAWFDYTRRHYEMVRNGVDPWRLAGGGTNRYPMVNTTGAGSYFNTGAPSSTSSGWAERMFAAHINTVWPYPW